MNNNHYPQPPSGALMEVDLQENGGGVGTKTLDGWGKG
ncbi:hypothetical protein D082_08970 [Synechocystis sp. PCC 6714]|nr:hypothetical protein D082_08970 [Synechocystis sp. PCC 6714]